MGKLQTVSKSNSVTAHGINNSNDAIVTRCYYNTLMFISRYIRKSNKITRKKIIDLELGNFGRYYKISTGFKKKYYNATFDLNTCVYYFWKRDLEYQYKDYYFYGVNALKYEKYYINPNYEIITLLKNYKTRLQNLNINANIVMDILIRISSELLINKYKLWERHVKEKINSQNIHKFMDIKSYGKLDDDETISKEFLILFNDKNNYHIYID